MKTKIETKRAQEWRRHMAGVEAYDGSVVGYCKEHGLQTSSYYYWRRIFFESSQKQDLQSFVPVVVKPEKSVSRTESLKENRPHPLPDAKWVAEVIANLIRGVA
jgi:transposase-like protein